MEHSCIESLLLIVYLIAIDVIARKHVTTYTALAGACSVAMDQTV